MNNWVIFVILYLISMTVFTNSYKLATNTLTKAGALTVLLQLIAGLIALVICPFFEFRFPTDIKIYIILGASIIFYTISDRLGTTVRKGIEASTYSILNQLSTTFMIFAGLIFFKEEFILTKFIGAMLIIFSNILIFYKRGEFRFDKYVLLGILQNLSLAVALFLDVNISEKFNLPFYVALTLIVPALLITIFERIKISDIKNELISGNKKWIFITAFSWTAAILTNLKSYQLGKVSVVAPLSALTVILNVIVGYLFLKEKDNLLRKIIAAALVITSVVLINI